jgi:hypothetical protein
MEEKQKALILLCSEEVKQQKNPDFVLDNSYILRVYKDSDKEQYIRLIESKVGN